MDSTRPDVPKTVARITCPLCEKRFSHDAKDLLEIGSQGKKLVFGRPVRSVEVDYDCPFCSTRGILVTLLHTDLSWGELKKTPFVRKSLRFFRSEAKVCWPAVEVPTLECIQLGHDRGSSQHALQCCKQPLRVVLFKVKLMCGHRCPVPARLRLGRNRHPQITRPR
jgi:hypothetical protein